MTLTSHRDPSTSSTLTPDDVADGWAAVRKALLVAYFGPIAFLIATCAVILLFAPTAQAQERPNHSPERLELIRRLQKQDAFLADETDRILGELASREFSFWTARQAIAWIRDQKPQIRRLEEIRQERRRNLSALYCSEFDRHNSLGLYSLGRLGLETSGLDLWPSEHLRPWENVEAFFWNVESVQRQAVETSQNVYHAYVVIEAFGSDCAPFVGVPLPPKEE